MEFGNQSKSYQSLLLRASLNGYKAFGFEQLTVGNTVVNLTIPTGAKYALIVVESTISTNCIRYLEFGGANKVVNNTTIGIPVSNGSVFDITDAQNLSGFQAIQVGAGTHKLNIQYYK